MESIETEALGGPFDGFTFCVQNVEYGDLLEFDRNFHEFDLEIEKEGDYKPLKKAYYELIHDGDRSLLMFRRLEDAKEGEIKL